MRGGLWLAVSLSGTATACLVDNPAWIGQTTTGGTVATSMAASDDAPSTTAATTGAATTDDPGTDGSSTGGDPPRVDLPTSCVVLEPPVDPPFVTVTPDQAAELDVIFAELPQGGIVAFEPGVYDRSGMPALVIGVRGTQLRSTTGIPSDVWIDGGGLSSEVLRITAGGVLIAEIGVRNAADNLITVASPGGAMLGPQLYRVNLVNSGGYALFAQADSPANAFVDEGQIVCSSFQLEAAFRAGLGNDCQAGAIQGYGTLAWVVRDNDFTGYFCPETVAIPAVRFTHGAKDTVILRNRFVDNFRALVLGAGGLDAGLCDPAEPPTRVYDFLPDGCTPDQYWGHLGGRVANNTLWVGGPEIANMETDSAMSLWCVCRTEVFHNTVVNLDVPFHSIEYRFDRTTATIANNLVSDTIAARDGATAQLTDENVELADLNNFVSALQTPPDLDLHLRETATEAIDMGLILPGEGVALDFERDERDAMPDHGADEFVP